jgi:hypothetical protein
MKKQGNWQERLTDVADRIGRFARRGAGAS